MTELRGQNEILALPAALGKLAKDWKVVLQTFSATPFLQRIEKGIEKGSCVKLETQKDHFPHYFTWILSKLPLIMKVKYPLILS
jgi:hypothetical protein